MFVEAVPCALPEPLLELLQFPKVIVDGQQHTAPQQGWCIISRVLIIFGFNDLSVHFEQIGEFLIRPCQQIECDGTVG